MRFLSVCDRVSLATNKIQFLKIFFYERNNNLAKISGKIFTLKVYLSINLAANLAAKLGNQSSVCITKIYLSLAAKL